MALNVLIKIIPSNIRLCVRTIGTRPYKIVSTDDKTTFVAWHPKEDFPHEYTKPIPKLLIEEDESILKTQLTPQIKEVFNKKTSEEARQELMNITFTTKHKWFPRSRDKKAKKTPMDREYL